MENLALAREDGILLSFDRARIIEVLAASIWDREIRLLDAAEHLVIQLLAEALERRDHALFQQCIGIGVAQNVELHFDKRIGKHRANARRFTLQRAMPDPTPPSRRCRRKAPGWRRSPCAAAFT